MNNKIIKDFDSFNDQKDKEMNESLFDSFKGLFGFFDFAGEGIRKTIKQKIVAKLMARFGILENSISSIILQEVVDQIPVKDYPLIFTGKNVNAEYLAPLVSNAITEVINRKGVDTIAEKIGIKPESIIFSIIRESLQSEQGRKSLKNAIDTLFKGIGGNVGSFGSDIINSLDKNEKKEILDAGAQLKNQGKLSPNIKKALDSLMN